MWFHRLGPDSASTTFVPLQFYYFEIDTKRSRSDPVPTDL
jgi:hypothetical protein